MLIVIGGSPKPCTPISTNSSRPKDVNLRNLFSCTLKIGDFLLENKSYSSNEYVSLGHFPSRNKITTTFSFYKMRMYRYNNSRLIAESAVYTYLFFFNFAF